MWEIIILVITLLLLLPCLSWIRRYKEWRHIMAIPGPKAYPILGTMTETLFHPDRIFYRDRDNCIKFAPIYKIWSFNIAMVCLVNAEDIELVLSNTIHNTKSHIYSFLHNWLGTGLLTSAGGKWKNRRKILTPAFHFTILQEFIKIFNNETEHLVKVLERDCKKPYIDVTKPVTEFTLYSIGETSLGVDLSKDNNSPYKKAIYEFGDLLTKRIIKPWYHNDFIYNLSKLARREREVVTLLHDFSTKVIKDRKKLFSSTGKISYSVRKRLAMLDLMLKANYDGADIDDEGVREEVDTFMFEGHDTTSMAICLSLMALSNEEKIQEEIVREIKEILGDSNIPPTYNKLMEMKFMERCIKECLRLYPSVPFIARVAGEDVKTYTGYTIPKGCDINIYIYDLHRSPKYWENPNKFDPDRFLPDNIAARHPFAYLPFSAGSRNCIGQKFALLEIKAALTGILRKFKLKPVSTPQDTKFKSDLVLRPIDEIKVKFELRE